MNSRIEAEWPIIIGGSHRSGTTLVRRLINAHPRIFCPSEIKFHRDLLGQYRDDPLAFARLGTTMAALGLERDEWLDEFGRALVRCYERAAAAQGKARWADKNPENASNIEHWRRLLLGRMCFVLVVRHPYDIVASMEETRMDRAVPTDPEGRARHILSYVAPGLDYCKDHPGHSFVLRYEDLVTAPEKTLTALMRSVGEDFDPGMMEGLRSPRSPGLEDPKAGGRAAISADGVGRWRRDLSAEAVAVIEPVLAGLMEGLGYARK